MEATTIFIWLLRIIPMVLFWLYLKGQNNKEKSYPGPTKNVVSRSKFLLHRKRTLGEPAPSGMATIHLVDQTSAPQLFVGQRPRGNTPKAEQNRQKQQRREARGDKKEGSNEKENAKAKEVEEANKTEKMHLESLVNYMAFNRKEPQRSFLLDEANPPPPPPVKTESVQISTATSEKANSEAQMVLKGAIKYKRCDVAKDLHDQLKEAKIDIAELTFSLMIEACICVGDLKDAGDFLMKMEAAGFCPDAELLDKVMDLYSQHKATRDQESFNSDEVLANTPMIINRLELEPPRAEVPTMGKLSSDAPAFVPSDVILPEVVDEAPADAGFYDQNGSAPQAGMATAFNFDAYSEDEDEE